MYYSTMNSKFDLKKEFHQSSIPFILTVSNGNDKNEDSSSCKSFGPPWVKSLKSYIEDSQK